MIDTMDLCMWPPVTKERRAPTRLRACCKEVARKNLGRELGFVEVADCVRAIKARVVPARDVEVRPPSIHVLT